MGHARLSMKARVLTFLIVVCSAFAALTCYYLVLKHITGSSGQSWFEAGCSDQPGGAFSCAAVLQSPYAYFPPKHADAPTDRAYFPVAFLGLLYYTSLCVWFLGIGAPSRPRAWLHGVATAFVGLGMISSVWFIWLMFREISAWCPWCIVTHVMNLTIAVSVVLLWPVVLRSAPDTSSRQETSDEPITGERPPTYVHPVGSTILMTVVAIVAANFGYLYMLGAETQKRQAEAKEGTHKLCMNQLASFKNVPKSMVALWEYSKPFDLPLRSDDPARSYGESGAQARPLEVVVFSDFECPNCHKFAVYFESQIAPMFDGRVLLIFKHYPIDRSCNPHVGGTLHPNACYAARMAEAARALGGMDGFWHAHDVLYNSRAQLAAGRLTPDQFAKELGLDPQAYKAAMDSPEVAARIAEDTQLAGKLGVTGTPAVYVENRELTPMPKIDTGFWNALADRYFERLGIPRPPHTLPSRGSTNRIESP